MEVFHQPMRLIACLVLIAGCHPLLRFQRGPEVEVAPTGSICRVVATWKNQVVFTPDPANGGRPTPGLAGRVYLFDQSIGTPLAGDGSLIVDLYDARPEVNDGKPLMLEQWRFDPETLQRLLRKDTIGYGYTLFLPWGTCKPEINRVVMKICYQPKNGTPLYADTALLTLQPEHREAKAALSKQP